MAWITIESTDTNWHAEYEQEIDNESGAVRHRFRRKWTALGRPAWLSGPAPGRLHIVAGPAVPVQRYTVTPHVLDGARGYLVRGPGLEVPLYHGDASATMWNKSEVIAAIIASALNTAFAAGKAEMPPAWK